MGFLHFVIDYLFLTRYSSIKVESGLLDRQLGRGPARQKPRHGNNRKAPDSGA